VNVLVVIDGDGDVATTATRRGANETATKWRHRRTGDGGSDESAATRVRRIRYMNMLSFQKLDVYRCAIEFVTFAMSIARCIPRGHADLRDQLRRAALSVPLNIAEGAGRISKADAARHFAIARGSAMECAAVLDVILALGMLQQQRHQQGIDMLARSVAMLTKLCR
jgi:four helix bundle protein